MSKIVIATQFGEIMDDYMAAAIPEAQWLRLPQTCS